MLQTSEEVWHGRHAPCKQLICLQLPRSSPDSLPPYHIVQATLEIEFMHQTLSRYVTSSAAKTLQDLYNKISQAYARRPGDENLQSHLDGVKKTLADTRRATGIEFLCFRATKERKPASKAETSGTPRKDRERSTREGR